jgi:hypothetical protein
MCFVIVLLIQKNFVDVATKISLKSALKQGRNIKKTTTSML